MEEKETEKLFTLEDVKEMLKETFSTFKEEIKTEMDSTISNRFNDFSNQYLMSKPEPEPEPEMVQEEKIEDYLF